MKNAVNRPKSFHYLRLLGFFGFFLGVVFPAVALDPARSIFQHNCRSWARQNGLPASGVYALAQTRDGYIWLGTAKGLVRFDGSEFKLFDLKQLPQARSTMVRSLSVSQRGGLWFGLERGAFGYCDGKTVSLAGKEAWGGLNLNVQATRETKTGDLWIAAETQVARLAGGDRYEPMLTGARASERFNVSALCEGADGVVWLGTIRRGLFFWKDGAIHQFSDQALAGLNIHSVVADRRGQIWVGTERGLICYDAAGQRKPLPFPWYETRALLEDKEGAIWVGTSGGGLVRYWNEEMTAFRKTDGLADDFVTALMQDQEGSLWIGTRNGLNQLSPVKIPTFGKTEGLTADVNISVAASRQGGLWISTGEGFTYFDGAARSYTNDVGLANTYIKRVFEARNGDLYLSGGSMDVEVFSGGKIIARHPNKTWPMAMTEDDQGVIVAVGGDLFRAGTNYYEPYAFTNNVKPDLSWIFNLVTSADGSIWVACDNGICRIKDGAYRLWTHQQGLPESKVIWVCEDEAGVIWAGTEAGMVRLKEDQVRTINRNDGLFDNIIYAIVPDDHGVFWMDSSQGLFSVTRQNLNDFADGKVGRVSYTAYDGLDAVKTDEKNQQAQAGCKTLDGKIWFPTAQGVVMIDPTNIAANPVAPQVHIQSVSANGVELELRGTNTVNPGKGELAFHYAGLSFVAPETTRYRYQLKGYDSDWVDAGMRRAAFYTNLKPGKYHFQVQACNGDGVWTKIGDSYTVELLPFFYQTTAFMVTTGLIIVSSGLGLIFWRVRRLQWQQQQLQESHDLLEAKVMERTGELAASNASLKNEIEERKRMEAEVEKIHSQLLESSRQAGQAEVASSVLHNVGNVLNSVNVSTCLLGDRLRRMGLVNLHKATQLLTDNAAGDLGRYLTEDQKGRLLPKYLHELARHLENEQTELLEEIKTLSHNVDHIKEIVAMQQSYAKVFGVEESIAPVELVESAMKMHSAAYERHSVAVVRKYDEVPSVRVEKHKVLQILVNILHNAKSACDAGGPPHKQVVVQVRRQGASRVAIEIADNGIGISPETMSRMFTQGFTTKKDGHGFGLHSAALAAKELGGTLAVHSAGLGHGATFILELPIATSETLTLDQAPAAFPPAAVPQELGAKSEAEAERPVFS